MFRTHYFNSKTHNFDLTFKVLLQRFTLCWEYNLVFVALGGWSFMDGSAILQGY
jgi:hypothetical protein